MAVVLDQELTNDSGRVALDDFAEAVADGRSFVALVVVLVANGQALWS